MALRRDAVKPWNKTSVMFVHGVGEQPKGYSDKLIDILRAEDPAWGDSTRWYELEYDSVNVALAEKCRGCWDTVKALPGGTIAESHMSDLLNFFLIKDAREWVDTLFRFELGTIIQAGQKSKPPVHQRWHRLFIIAHSLGTFVSYEGLHGIVGEATTFGVLKGLVVRGFFTMGSPLGVIRRTITGLPQSSGKFAISNGLRRPTDLDPIDNKMVSNVAEWLDYRHRYDPIALVSLQSEAEAGTLSANERIFEKFHCGANMHEFSNYVTEYAGEFVARMKE
jgi:hypothetical protein